MEINKVDIKENAIKALDPKLLKLLLRDKTTGKNILWATSDYVQYGDGYATYDEITIESITGDNGDIIKPRIEKTKEEKTARSKDKAEVFTPSWVCNKQNNLVDNEWFGYENVFNIETDNGWITNENKVIFPNTKGKTWQDYVKTCRLEISCGEAPYLASRYDTVSGEEIPVKDRIGLLDRKLRVVSENVDSEPEWVKWAIKAVQSVYGYEWQGDNILLARENILYTFAEHYMYKFTVPAIPEYLKKIARIVSWNIWQMDGIKFVVPNSCYKKEVAAPIIDDMPPIYEECPGCATNDHSKHNGIYAQTYDWVDNHSKYFYSFIDPTNPKFRRKKNGSKI